MDNQNSTIVFSKSRSFAGKLSASLKFVNDNFRVLFKLGSYILLPFSVILAALFAAQFYYSYALSSAGYIALIIAVVLLSIIGGSVFYAFLFTCLQEYKKEGYIGNLTFSKIRSALIVNSRKMLLVSVATCLCVCILIGLTVALAVLSMYTLILMIPLFFFLLIPLVYIGYLYILEDITFVASIKEAFKIGVPTWSSTFGILFISGALVGIVQFVASIPWILCIVAESFAQAAILNGEVVTLPGYFTAMIFSFAVIAMFLSAFAEVLVIISMAFQYYSEKTRRAERLAEVD